MGVFSFILYSFNIFTFGFALIPFLASLLFFGIILGIFTTALIFRFGSSSQVIAWGFLALIQPFTAVFYPVSALPNVLQNIAYFIPSTYVFEGMRKIIATGTFPLRDLGLSFLLNAVYFALVVWYFYAMFAWVKRKGRLAKLDF
jgi:ABC-2 type transport system permease protein